VFTRVTPHFPLKRTERSLHTADHHEDKHPIVDIYALLPFSLLCEKASGHERRPRGALIPIHYYKTRHYRHTRRVRVPKTPSAVPPRAQRNASRRRDARQQSRSFARWNQSLKGATRWNSIGRLSMLLLEPIETEDFAKRVHRFLLRDFPEVFPLHLFVLIEELLFRFIA